MSHLTPIDPPRRFGLITSFFVVIASMVGSGILSNSGPILTATGSSVVLLVLWIVGGMLSLAGALTLGEMASAFPRVGGDYFYVREAFGRAWGFVYGWSMLFLGFAAPVALVAYSTASYLFPVVKGFLPSGLLESIFVNALASLLISGFTIAHCLGHTESAWVQNLTTVFNLLILVVIATAGILFGTHTAPSLSGQSLSSVSFASLGTGLILVMYAYTGWNGAIYLAGEVKHPERILPRSLFLGCLAVAVLYVLMNVMYVLAIDPATVKALSSVEMSRFAEVAVRHLFGESVAKAFSLLVSLGTFAALSAFTLAGPRIAFAMARDGLLPRAAMQLHPKSEVPVWAILLQGAIALVLLWSGSFESILGFAGYGLAVISNFVLLPVFVLRRRKDYQPRFRVPWYPLTPLVFLVVNMGALIAGFIDAPKASLLSLASIGVGFPLYWVQEKIKRWKGQ